MAMTVGGSGGGVTATINMTPMIDVLLVLLIIFMAISPIAPKGLEALVPQPSRNPHFEPEDTAAVVIVIDKDHQWKINQENIAEDRLEDRLVEILKTRADRTVFVKGDPSLEYMWVARAIDHAHGANIDKVGLMTPKVEQSS